MFELVRIDRTLIYANDKKRKEKKNQFASVVNVWDHRQPPTNCSLAGHTYMHSLYRDILRNLSTKTES